MQALFRFTSSERGHAGRAVGLAAVAVAALALAACSSSGSSGGSDGGSGPSVLKLGVPYAQTGAIAQFGRDFSNGVRMAIDEANATGGVDINGKKVKVEASYCDTGYQTDKAVTCGKQLQTKDHVSVMIVGTSLEALPMLTFNNSAAQGKFQLIAGSGVAALTGQTNPLVGRYFFNTATYLPTWAPLLAKASDKYSLGIEKVAVMQSDDEFGQGWTTNFTKAWQGLGKSVNAAKYTDGATDFYPQLTALLKNKPDAIAVVAACGPDAAILKQARQLGFKGRFIVQVSCDPSSLAKLMAPKDFEGSVFEANNFSLTSPEVTKFKADYQTKFNAPATVATVYGYGEANWAIAAANSAKSADPTAIRAAMPGVLNDAPWNIAGFSNMQASGEVDGAMHVAYVKSIDDIIQFTG